MDHLEAVLDQLLHGAELELDPRALSVNRTLLRLALTNPDHAPDWVLLGIQLRIDLN